jgi:hypothetical protein
MDPHHFGKLDPDPDQNEKQDPDPNLHQCEKGGSLREPFRSSGGSKSGKK